MNKRHIPFSKKLFFFICIFFVVLILLETTLQVIAAINPEISKGWRILIKRYAWGRQLYREQDNLSFVYWPHLVKTVGGARVDLSRLADVSRAPVSTT